jgi:hypothetical protein
MATEIYMNLTQQEKREVAVFGCTEAQMRQSIESSFTFRYYGGKMIALSLLSDAQEHINDEHGDVDWNRREDARQTINRAKWVLETYCTFEEGPFFKDKEPVVPF